MHVLVCVRASPANIKLLLWFFRETKRLECASRSHSPSLDIRRYRITYAQWMIFDGEFHFYSQNSDTQFWYCEFRKATIGDVQINWVLCSSVVYCLSYGRSRSHHLYIQCEHVDNLDFILLSSICLFIHTIPYALEFLEIAILDVNYLVSKLLELDLYIQFRAAVNPKVTNDNSLISPAVPRTNITVEPEVVWFEPLCEQKNRTKNEIMNLEWLYFII